MLSFFEKYRLVKKGLSSPKARRRRSDNEWLRAFETSPRAKSVILAVFLASIAALIFSSHPSQPVEKALIALLVFLVAMAHLRINHPRAFAKNSRIVLLFGAILFQLAATAALLAFARKSTGSTREFATLLIPYSLAPLLCSVTLGRNHGVYAAIYTSLWGAVTLLGINAETFLVMNLVCGVTAVFVIAQARRRRMLLRAGAFVGLATLLLALVFGQGYPGLINPIVIEVPHNIDWKTIGWQCVVAFLSGPATAMLVIFLLPAIERAFDLTTDIAWVDLADLNHPLLKRLTIEAPGTYHHSLVVANLAEAAAEAIGANGTAARVCSYFHDIGKLVKPEYFAENMSAGENPHDKLTPTMSAIIITAHVKEGVDLALKHRLNQRIVDVIEQHHGTTLVRYFHYLAIRQQDEARAGGKIMNIREDDIPDVSEESFRYAGPKPQFKECAIVMLADAIESASRSLEKITPQKIDQLINDIIEARIREQQLDECEMTLGEIRAAGESFKFTMQTMLHGRIAYPTENAASHDAPQPRRTADLPPVTAA